MSQSHFEVSETINASPADVYRVLSDYRVSHPAILPRPYFSKLVVQGGHGAGTIIEIHMDVFGTKRVLHPVVSEPEPGRVLVETDLDAGVVTTFRVDPIGEGSQSRVTFATDSRTSRGLLGFMERLFQLIVLRRIYKKELLLLTEYVRRGS